jgi:chromosome segregation ATPase
VNEKISILEEKLRPEYKDTLRKKIRQKEKEIRSLSKPDEVAIPELESKELKDISLEINNLNKDIRKNVLEQDELSKNLIANNKLLSICEKLQNRVSNLQSEFDHFISESKEDFETLGIEIDDVVEFSVSMQPLQTKVNTLEKNVSKLEARYDEIDASIQDHKNKIKDLEIRLDEPNRRYQEYVTALRDWEEQTKELTGDSQTPDTLEYFKNQQKELDELPVKLASLEDDRFLIAGEIFLKKEEIAEIYRRLYSPVQEFIERQELGDEFKLQFSVSILPENFKEQFFKFRLSRN